MSEKLCHCGKPLHYTNPSIKRMVDDFVDALGEFIPVTVLGKGTYLAPRHYVSLHGLKAEEIDKLGFEKVV